MMRELIEKQEKRAYYNPGIVHNLRQFKILYNQRIKKYVYQALHSYSYNRQMDVFEKYFCIEQVLIKMDDNDLTTIFEPFSVG